MVVTSVGRYFGLDDRNCVPQANLNKNVGEGNGKFENKRATNTHLKLNKLMVVADQIRMQNVTKLDIAFQMIFKDFLHIFERLLVQWRTIFSKKNWSYL